MNKNISIKWRDDGVMVIPATCLDVNTPQTPGMKRAAAITHDRTGINIPEMETLISDIS